MDAVFKSHYRSDELKEPEAGELFLEWDGTVRLHYRDLRLEMGRDEFEEFVATLNKQAADLKAALDGQTPGETPAETIRVWTDCQLKAAPAAHPRRVALEEGPDGYRLQVRNYRLLLDDRGFGELKAAFTAAERDAPTAATLDELTDLLEANEIRFTVPEQDPDAVQQRLIVLGEDAARIRKIFTGIGMVGRLTRSAQIYAKPGLSVVLEVSDDASLFAED